MNYQKEVNHYLGVRFIKAPIYSEAEIKEKIGVSLSELRHLWIFESKNNFRDAVEFLIKYGVKIDFEAANASKDKPYIPF